MGIASKFFLDLQEPALSILRCAICDDIVEKAMTCGNIECQQLRCEMCVPATPCCAEPFARGPRFMDNILSKYKFQCPRYEVCQTILTFAELDAHRIQCTYLTSIELQTVPILEPGEICDKCGDHEARIKELIAQIDHNSRSEKNFLLVIDMIKYTHQQQIKEIREEAKQYKREFVSEFHREAKELQDNYQKAIDALYGPANFYQAILAQQSSTNSNN